MICPHCNIPMNHLNQGGGFSGVDAYQTYDTLECPKCLVHAVEVYHTEFIDPITIGIPSISITQSIKLKRKGGKWTPISEPPTEAGDYIVSAEGCPNGYPVSWDEGWYSEHYSIEGITHWMKFPESVKK